MNEGGRFNSYRLEGGLKLKRSTCNRGEEVVQSPVSTLRHYVLLTPELTQSQGEEMFLSFWIRAQ